MQGKTQKERPLPRFFHCHSHPTLTTSITSVPLPQLPQRQRHNQLLLAIDELKEGTDELKEGIDESVEPIYEDGRNVNAIRRRK